MRVLASVSDHAIRSTRIGLLAFALTASALQVGPSQVIAPRSLLRSKTAPMIFGLPACGNGFVRRVTQSRTVVPIATFVIVPHVFGAVNVRYVICPPVVPQTRRPLLPVLSQAKSSTRVVQLSLVASWVTKFDHPLPLQ